MRSVSLFALQVWLRIGPTSWVVIISQIDFAWAHAFIVKWLGPDAINPLAVDGKGTKAQLLEAVARWVAARGRNVTQPGMLLFSPGFSIPNLHCI